MVPLYWAVHEPPLRDGGECTIGRFVNRSYGMAADALLGGSRTAPTGWRRMHYWAVREPPLRDGGECTIGRFVNRSYGMAANALLGGS